MRFAVMIPSAALSFRECDYATDLRTDINRFAVNFHVSLTLVFFLLATNSVNRHVTISARIVKASAANMVVARLALTISTKRSS